MWMVKIVVMQCGKIGIWSLHVVYNSSFLFPYHLYNARFTETYNTSDIRKKILRHLHSITSNYETMAIIDPFNNVTPYASSTSMFVDNNINIGVQEKPVWQPNRYLGVENLETVILGIFCVILI